MQCPASSKFRCVYLLTHTGRHHYKQRKYEFHITCKISIVANNLVSYVDVYDLIIQIIHEIWKFRNIRSHNLRNYMPM